MQFNVATLALAAMATVASAGDIVTVTADCTTSTLASTGFALPTVASIASTGVVTAATATGSPIAYVTGAASLNSVSALGMIVAGGVALLLKYSNSDNTPGRDESLKKIIANEIYADWCQPCKQIAPIYEQLSAQLSRPNHITFVKVNVDTQKEIAANYAVTAMPTFMIFKQGKVVEKVQGADPRKLQAVVKKLAAEAEGGSGSGFGSMASGSGWRTGDLPKGYGDITDQVDVKGLELLNADTEFGGVRVLFEASKPTGLQKGKASENQAKDWVESDTDEQLMMFVPFQATLKVHTLQITSLPPAASDDDDDEVPLRPRTIKLYSNRPHILGFEEADDIPATQSIELSEKDWDLTGTATLSLRFVKFQNVTSLVMFVVDGDGEGERVRIDRIRIIGETGEKRELGKLEKIGDEAGEYSQFRDFDKKDSMNFLETRLNGVITDMLAILWVYDIDRGPAGIQDRICIPKISHPANFILQHIFQAEAPLLPPTHQILHQYQNPQVSHK
ncbi:hypothetical protein G7Y89_g4380 [Cudoniella acicularis]|uniref:Thioredoxin domain-containing protein n=1 Tax=Cudoniella acicularis TaxID=354080 RepID=A0A8H4W4R5_9HELO|nr:hypothetical protein G7Y89_g4380 [Cudoniella acicularis]